MPSYSANNRLGGTQQVMTTTYKTCLSVSAQTTGLRRAHIYELNLGVDGTPADNVVVWDVSRQTTAGTGGAAVTPLVTEPADTASTMVAYANPTAEPGITATSSMLTVAVNQRATYRWVAVLGQELVIPATNLNGIATRALSPVYTSTFLATVMWLE